MSRALWYFSHIVTYRCVPRMNTDYLIIYCVGSILIGRPFHEARLAVIAFESQGTLISTEGRELIRRRLVLIRHPVAKATYAGGDDLTALSTYTREYLYFLSRSESEQPCTIPMLSGFIIFYTFSRILRQVRYLCYLFIRLCRLTLILVQFIFCLFLIVSSRKR